MLVFTLLLKTFWYLFLKQHYLVSLQTTSIYCKTVVEQGFQQRNSLMQEQEKELKYYSTY